MTHDQEEALALADRIAVMRDGRIEQIAEPTRLYEAPATRFVADFIGRSNLLPARVVERRHEVYVCRVGAEETVTVLATIPADVGGALLVAARPETLRILDEDKEAPGANVLRRIVEHVTYLGVLTQVRVQLDSGELVYVVEQNARWHRERPRLDKQTATATLAGRMRRSLLSLAVAVAVAVLAVPTRRRGAATGEDAAYRDLGRWLRE
jgi:ABC-type Fe3+/spermidine/putrescine transport system ATPase subunit